MKNTVHFSVKITLLLCFIFITGHSQNLIDDSSWLIGTGSVTGFKRYGSDIENVRELGIDPYGQSNVLWAIYPDGSNNSDGGWLTDDIQIDASKSYRFTVWAKKTISFDCTNYYYGRSKDSSGNNTTLKLNGTSSQSATFFAGNLPGLDEWYLVVGYIHESGYNNVTSLGGIYDADGNKVLSKEDYKFAPTATSIHQRVLNGYCAETTSRQYYYLPTIYEINGLEPTIQELLDVPNNNDTQAPLAPTLTSTGKTDTTVDLSWSGATDNVGVTGYKLYKDNILEATLGNVSTYQVTGLIASTNYAFKVRALDSAGNESPYSNFLSITTDASSGSGGNSGSTSIWSESNSVASYTGNVAVGRSSVPTGYKMAVEGKIRTREVRVDQENWPDYVFEEDYNLPTLEEIQKHIDENGHLPEVPSAGDVETNGIELGEMNRLLLKKIEELTLYIIKLQKTSQMQQREINMLNQKL